MGGPLNRRNTGREFHASQVFRAVQLCLPPDSLLPSPGAPPQEPAPCRALAAGRALHGAPERLFCRVVGTIGSAPSSGPAHSVVGCFLMCVCSCPCWLENLLPGGGRGRGPTADVSSSNPENAAFTESQNHRMVGVGRDLCGSSSPTLLPKQGHLQQAA